MCNQTKNRLIRLMTKVGESQGHIRQGFLESFKIEPYSKIALVNASIKLDTRNITVDDNNNTFTFQTKGDVGAENLQVTLLTGRYNFTQLSDMLISQMNKAIKYTDLPQTTTLKKSGFEWLPYELEDKIQLSFGRSEYLNLELDNLNNMVFDAGTTTYNSQNIASKTWGAFASSDGFFINGSGSVECKMLNNNIADSGNVFFGLASRIPADNELLQPSNDFIEFGFWSDNSGTGTVKLIRPNLNIFDTSEAIADNVTWQIRLDQGKIKFFKGNTEIPDTAVDFDFSKQYHILICGKNNNDGVKDLFYHLTPFQNISVDGKITDDFQNVYATGENDLQLGVPKANKTTIDFTDGSKDLLGFHENKLSAKAVKYTFQGKTKLEESNIPSNITVLAPSFSQLNSFDGNQGIRDQILAVIPSIVLDDNNKLTYEPTFPLEISIENHFPFNKSQFELRFIDSNTNQELNIEDPGITTTLMITHHMKDN